MQSDCKNLCWMQLCPSRSYAHWRCASDVISEQKKWPQFYHPFPLSVIQYISIVNLLVVHFHSCKTQCDSMSLVVSGSLLLQTFLQTTRARRSIPRFFKSHAVLALDRYCHAHVLGRCQQLHSDHDDYNDRCCRFRIHGRSIFCSCGTLARSQVQLELSFKHETWNRCQ